MKNKLVVVFDLDDTLYYEIDFLKSAYKEIAIFIKEKEDLTIGEEVIYLSMLHFYNKGGNAFSNIIGKYGGSSITIKDLLYLYRNHKPAIQLSSGTVEVLNFLNQKKISIGLITDGRSIQQRSKIEALGLNHYLKHIIISEEFGSEKPSKENYVFFENKYKGSHFMYVGDNVKKDFITPNKLGWYTVCLRDKEGLNVHSQNIEIPKEYKPQFKIDTIVELKDLIVSLQV